MKIRFGGLRQHGNVESRFKVAIALDANTRCTLELSFGEFRFDQEISNTKIHFGALHMLCDQGYPGLAAKLKTLGRFGAKQNAERTTSRKSLRVTEDIHKKCVRTRGGIQFPSSRVMTYQTATRGGVKLREPAAPFGLPANGFVRCRVKVSMNPIPGLTK